MKINRLEFAALALAVASLASSCMMPDPSFMQNAASIQDINYPASKIFGDWVAIHKSPVQSSTLDIEDKQYFNFSAGGRGKVRQYSKNNVTGHFLSAEAPFQWTYNGNNRWYATIPPSSAYKVTDCLKMTMGNSPGREALLRYHEGNLYEMTSGKTFVRPTRENISRLADEVRSQPPVIVIE